jgi:acetyl esterase
MVNGPRTRLLRVPEALAEGAVDAIVHGVSLGSRYHPRLLEQSFRVTVERNIRYTTSEQEHHLVDIYRPKYHTETLPLVVYFHGGGFRSVSKDINWMMPLGFAHRGYVVCNFNYRLAPAHRYPSAHEDAFAAWQWALDHAKDYGADSTRVVVAGDSAGANLGLAVVLAACHRSEHALGHAVFDRGVVPAALVAKCGLLEVQNPERLRARSDVKAISLRHLRGIADAYLGTTTDAPWANPLPWLESLSSLARPLPPVFASVGTADPLVDDSERLVRAFARHGADAELKLYARGVHAFQAIAFTRLARSSWADTHAFLDRTLAAPV